MVRTAGRSHALTGGWDRQGLHGGHGGPEAARRIENRLHNQFEACGSDLARFVEVTSC